MKLLTHDIDAAAIQKVKSFLQTDKRSGAIEMMELLEGLKEYRKKIHPDRFTEENAKKKAEEKFKETGKLIEELDRFIQIDKVNRSAQELALYEPHYEKMAMQKELEEAKQKADRLESTVEYLQQKNDELQKELDSKQTDELEKETQELMKLYKPSTQKIATLGIVFLLSIALTTMTKIEEVYNIVQRYSPIDEKIIKGIVFAVFIYLLILVVKQYIENRFFARKIAEVCSPLFCKNFFGYLGLFRERESDDKKFFTESEVFDFIHQENKWKKALAFFGFRMFQIETSDKLKDYFINTLLTKKLTNVHYAKDLDRAFSIKDDGKHECVK